MIAVGVPGGGQGSVTRVLRRLLLPALFVAVIVAGIDIVQWLRAAPLWVDEEMIAINLRDRPFGELAGPLWLGQSAPLGWLVVQRATLLVLGTNELVLRLVPLLFGLATLAAATWVGQRWMHRWTGALLVALCGISEWMSHYVFELKHYSADAFWALLLPALAAWAAEETDLAHQRWRWTRWWALAAIAQWTANGAILVTPACAVILAAVVFRRQGFRAAAAFAVTGSLWLSSLGAHYALSLQYTHHSRYLRDYWSAYVLQRTDSIPEAFEWFAGRLEPLALHPGGTELTAVFWLAALAGLLVSRHRMLASMFASVPVSGFLLAGIGLVPLHERIALWIAPALYAGVVLLADEGLHRARHAWRSRQWRVAAPVALAIATSVYISADILRTGAGHLDLGVPGDSNHALDDRTAVRWLIERRRPGDAIISTRLGWPAIFWYGDIGLRRPPPAGFLPDGARIWELTQDRPKADCLADLREALAPHERALVHVGFPDSPPDFFNDVVEQLEQIGTVIDSASFSAISRVAVVDLHQPNRMAAVEPAAAGTSGSRDPGCIGLHVARRW